MDNNFGAISAEMIGLGLGLRNSDRVVVDNFFQETERQAQSTNKVVPKLNFKSFVNSPEVEEQSEYPPVDEMMQAPFSDSLIQLS
jgi:hypothetical protein